MFHEAQLPDVFILGDGRITRDWKPFHGRIYNNSPITTACKVKLVSWGFNRKRENLTTSSSTVQINLLPQLVPTENQDTFYTYLFLVKHFHMIKCLLRYQL